MQVAFEFLACGQTLASIYNLTYQTYTFFQDDNECTILGSYCQCGIFGTPLRHPTQGPLRRENPTWVRETLAKICHFKTVIQQTFKVSASFVCVIRSALQRFSNVCSVCCPQRPQRNKAPLRLIISSGFMTRGQVYVTRRVKHVCHPL